MDNSLKFFRILELLIEGSRTVKEISEILFIDVSEIKGILSLMYKFNIDGYWNIEVYKEGIPVDDLEEVEEEIDTLEVMAWCSLKDVDDINDFTRKQRWVLYDMFRECGGTFIDDVRTEVLSRLDDEWQNAYKQIADRRIVKQYLDIFDISEEIILSIYEGIDKLSCLNLVLMDGKNLSDISPIKIYYDEELVSWYLQYSKKKRVQIIRLDKIQNVKPSKYCYYKMNVGDYSWGFGNKEEIVKIKVYDERNAKELTIRFISRKNIISLCRKDSYWEFQVKVSDMNLFKRWLRKMGPHVIAMEPEYLRVSMRKEAEEWKRKIECTSAVVPPSQGSRGM